MSGWTRVTQERELYALALESPCISFALDPNGPRPGPTTEQRYHAAAHARFEAQLAQLDPGLGHAIAALRATCPSLIPYASALPRASTWNRVEGPCRCVLRVATPPGSPCEPIDAELQLCFSSLPPPEELDRLRDAVARAIDDLRQADRLRALAAAAVDEPRPAAPARSRWRWLALAVVVLVVLVVLAVAAALRSWPR